MADPPPTRGRGGEHLDASGRREVVFCHQCDNEWWKDEHGLVCPRCDGEATEIVSLRNDPRSIQSPPDPSEELNRLRDHDPWEDEDMPDPEEGDIDQFLHRSQSGRTTFFSSTFTANGPRGATRVINRQGPPEHGDPTNVIRDIQTMVGTFMGPGLQQGQAGRSGPDALFPRSEPDPFRRNPFGGGMMGGGAPDRPQIVGHRFTVTAAGRRPRDPNGEDLVADDLLAILGSLFGPEGPLQGGGPRGDQAGGLPAGLPNFFASVLHPRTGIAGDAVYSQEALDRIISNLMEQHPQSNAPGPATQEAIANLPKKNLNEIMLGPELKAECSVCMDEVTVGDEVVVLPCTHWFHETCATAWLSEHNTCPICRTGIGGDADPPQSRRASHHGPSPPARQETTEREWDRHRQSSRHPPPPPINEARLSSIRDRSGFPLNPTLSGGGHGGSSSGPRRHQIIGESDRYRNRTPSPPAVYSSYSPHFRRRDSEISEGQRESRRNTSGSDRSQRSANSARTGESTGSGGGLSGWIRRLGRGGDGSSQGHGQGNSHSQSRRG